MKRWMLGVFAAGMLGMPSAALAKGGGHGVAGAQMAQIERLTATYAWAVDALDIDTLMTVFTDDIEYDLSAYGWPNVKGKDAVRAFFLNAVFPTNQCSFIIISSVWADFEGSSAVGGDYYLHTGYNPRGLPANTRRQTEGRHHYRFERVRGEWAISYLKGELFFQRSESDVPPPANCPMAPAM